MEGKTQQEPAVAVVFVQIHTHTLIITGRQRPTCLLLSVCGQFFNNLLTLGLKLAEQNVHTEFLALCGLFQCCNQGLQGVAFLFVTGKFDQ